MLPQILHRKALLNFSEKLEVARIHTHENKAISSESTHASTDIQKARQTNRQTDRQTDGRTDGQTDRQSYA